MNDMNTGLTIAQTVENIKECVDDKALAIFLSDLITHFYITEDSEDIDRIDENSIATCFDNRIATLLSSIDIAKSQGDDYGTLTQDDLLKISKAGIYVRYAAYDLVKGLKAYMTKEKVDFKQIMLDAIDKKIEEDTIDPATEEEVDNLISETDEIVNSMDDDSDEESESPANEDNPFYENGNDSDTDEYSNNDDAPVNEGNN